MEYHISKPHPSLAEFVRHYWTLEHGGPVNGGHVQRIVPNGLIDLTFYFDRIPESLDKQIAIDETTGITGQLSRYYDLRITHRLQLFSIIFQPAGLAVLLDTPLRELFNRNIPLKYLLKDQTNALEDRLYEARTFSERIRIVEQFLFDRLKKHPGKPHLPRMRRSVALINQSRGMVSVDDLAAESCLSRKQFERVFQQYIGTSPRRFMRIVRFQNALYEKSLRPELNLTSLTYRCGYFDQSHMTHDFLQISGMTPKEYFRAGEPFSDYFL